MNKNQACLEKNFFKIKHRYKKIKVAPRKKFLIKYRHLKINIPKKTLKNLTIGITKTKLPRKLGFC